MNEVQLPRVVILCWRHSRPVWLALAAASVWLSAASAGAQTSETGARTILEVSPAAVPNPPLKYRLFPGYGECKHGNAAVYYGKVTAEENSTYGNRDYMQGMRSLQQMSAEEILKSPELERYSRAPGYYMLRAASLCDSCDWQIPIRDENAAMVLLPEVQQTSTFQRFLSLQAIAQIRANDLAGALETIQTGMVLAHNIGQAPVLVNGLVAVANFEIIRVPLKLLIEQPETPSLYWALAWRPRPLVDLRLPFEAENLFLRGMTGFSQLDSESTDPQFWSEQYFLARQSIFEGHSGRPDEDRPALFRALAWYPQAKKILLESGMTETDVERMPVAKAMLIADRMEYIQTSQQFACLATVPWWQLTGIVNRLVNRQESASLSSGLGIAGEGILLVHVRTERDFNALQTIEAIRHFAATHNGQLPDSLDQLTETPAPDDPTTGNPFQYRRQGNSVFIDSPDIGGGPAFGYEVRFRE